MRTLAFVVALVWSILECGFAKDWNERISDLEQEPLSEMAQKNRYDVVYRFWNLPAWEHRKSTPFVVHTLTVLRSEGTPSQYSGTLSVAVGMPDGKVFRESMPLGSEAVSRIGKVFWLTEVLSLPREPISDGGIYHPYEEVVFHAGSYQIEGYDRGSQKYAEVIRSRSDDSAAHRVHQVFLAESEPLLERILPALKKYDDEASEE